MTWYSLGPGRVAGYWTGPVSEVITEAEVSKYREAAEAVWGKFVPGSLLRQPRFIPGTKRQRLPLFEDRHGVPHEAGWIDEDGVHYYPYDRLII
jgi:hypothetical protein